MKERLVAVRRLACTSAVALLACAGGGEATRPAPESSVAPVASTASEAAPPTRVLGKSADDVADLLEKGVDIKIYKGKKATPGMYPWMVSFVDKDRPTRATCGGSLVASDWILTAAHCKLRPAEDSAIVGRIDLESVGGSVKSLDRFCASPDGADLALVHLSAAASERSIDLYPRPDPGLLIGSRMQILGWGLTESGRRSRHLLYAEVSILDRADCARRLAGILTPCPTCICGWDNGGIADACIWDSGGPGVIKQPGGVDYVQVGLISESAGCGAVPGVYPFVPAHADWIERTIAGSAAAAVCAGT